MTDDDDTTDDEDDEDLTPIDAFEELVDKSGQSYMLAEGAWAYLQPFTKTVTDQFVRDYDERAEEGDDIEGCDRAFALSKALADKQRATEDARGFINAWPHEQVVTAVDVTAILVEAIGEEPSNASYAGRGFTADARHDANVNTIDNVLDLDKHLDDE